MAKESNGTHYEYKEAFTKELQENILTALCFDKDAALVIRRTVEPALFENETYRRIAEEAVKYIDQFAEPPGHHLPDLLEKYIADATPRRREVTRKTLRHMRAAAKRLNSAYVVSRLEHFVRQRKLILAIMSAITAVQAGRVDDTEMVLRNALSERIETFDPGLSFWEPGQALRFFDTEAQALPLNIEPLDTARIGPAPGELLTFIAPTGTGKTWFLGDVAKHAVMLRKKTLIISLEMTPNRLEERFVQAYLAYGKRKFRDAAGQSVDHVYVSRFLTGTDTKMGRDTLRGIKRRKLVCPTLDDENARAEITEYFYGEYSKRLHLQIKYFQPYSLTMDGLQAYLDNLDQQLHFQPDVLILDYADLMQQDANNLRISLEQTYQKLRGLAVERNLAVVTASQANRLGSQNDTNLITLAHVAESVGKVNVADNVITYNQSRKEQPYGLARLFVAKARNETSHFTVAITQAYQIGQFCLDAIRIPDEQYWKCVDELVDKYGE